MDEAAAAKLKLLFNAKHFHDLLPLQFWNFKARLQVCQGKTKLLKIAKATFDVTLLSTVFKNVQNSLIEILI